MNLKNQYCTFEQSKKLLSLGVIGACHSFIFNSLTKKAKFTFFSVSECAAMEHASIYYDTKFIFYPAFSVCELGELIGSSFTLPAIVDETLVCPGQIVGLWSFINDCGRYENYSFEAEARAALLINLLENKLLTALKINRQLAS